MIVKDEAANLGPCIHSVKPVVDEIIVVDTGSTDDTREIARQLGARVFDFAWRDDFSAARNESIRQATGDYILWLDADDRMESSEVRKLKSLKKMLDPGKNKAYYLVVNSQSPLDGETLFQQLRIFPKIPGAAFEGKVHEQIFHVLGAQGIQFVKTDILIRHTGYLDTATILKKSERNLAILKKELESQPNNLLLHYNAARTLSGIGRHSEAILHLRRISDDPNIEKKDNPFFLAAALLLGKYYTDVGRYDEAVSVYRELARDFVNQGLVHYCLGQALFLVHDFQGACQALEQSLRFPIEVSLFPTNLNGIRYYQYYTLGECYLKTGDRDRAEEMLIRSLDFPADHQKSLQTLGILALQSGRFEEALPYYQKVVQEGKGSDETYCNLGLALQKLGRSSEAEGSLRRALKMNPQRVEALANLGHLYQERRDYAQALECFSKALDVTPHLLDARLSLSEIYFRLFDLEKLVAQCDALLAALNLPRNFILNNFEDLSFLFAMAAEELKRQSRNELALMAYQVSFLIHPTEDIMEKAFSLPLPKEILSRYAESFKEALHFHGIKRLSPQASGLPG